MNTTADKVIFCVAFVIFCFALAGICTSCSHVQENTKNGDCTPPNRTRAGLTIQNCEVANDRTGIAVCQYRSTYPPDGFECQTTFVRGGCYEGWILFKRICLTTGEES